MGITELGGLPLHLNVLESPVGKLKKLGVTQMAGSWNLLETSSPFGLEIVIFLHERLLRAVWGKLPGIAHCDQDSQVIEQHSCQTLAEQAYQVLREED